MKKVLIMLLSMTLLVAMMAPCVFAEETVSTTDTAFEEVLTEEEAVDTEISDENPADNGEEVLLEPDKTTMEEPDGFTTDPEQPAEEEAVILSEEDGEETVDLNETAYDIYVQGIQVTEANKEDVLGDGSGSVKYDAFQNCLYLNDAEIKAKEIKNVYGGTSVIAGILCKKETNITVSGNCLISYKNTAGKTDNIFGILNYTLDDGARLWIRNGKLKINLDGCGADAWIFGMSAEYLFFTSADIEVSVSNSKVARCLAGNNSEWDDAVRLLNSKIKINAENVQHCYGICGETAELSKSEVEMDLSGSEHCVGIKSGKTEMDDSSLQIQAESSSGDCCGVANMLYVLREYDITINADGATNGYGVGCFCEKGYGVAEITGTTWAIQNALGSYHEYEGDTTYAYTPVSAYVNTAPQSEGRTLWDQKTPLGGLKSPYKYFRIPGDVIPVYSIQISSPAYDVFLGDKLQLTAEVTPSNATDQELVWESSNPDVISVDQEGNIEVHKYGAAFIKVSLASGKEVNADSLFFMVRFRDVVDSLLYYYTAVYYLASRNIANGYSDGRFGPDDSCTRKQMMIILWRTAGRPNVTGEMPFADVNADPDTDTYKAIVWGANKGIVKGYKNGDFGPDDAVTRKQTVIMLYRLMGRPKVTGEMKFSDVTQDQSTDAYKAVLWAGKKKIVGGYADGTFRPNRPCLRKHIATFIYRGYNRGYI